MSKKSAKASDNDLCPCGSGKPYALCCAEFIEGNTWPETASELMRSRYTAYVKLNDDWLSRTWAEETRPQGKIAEASIKWLGLKIVDTQTIDETHATVTFTARGRAGGSGAFRMTEKSRFEKRGGKWIYVDGDVEEK